MEFETKIHAIIMKQLCFFFIPPIIQIIDSYVTLDFDFAHTDLHCINFFIYVFEHLNFNKANLQHTRFFDCNFKKLVFSNANLDHAQFENCDFTECKFANTRLMNAKIKNCNFIDCDFSNALCSYLECKQSFWRRCSLIKSNFQHAIFLKTTFQIINCSCSDWGYAIYTNGNARNVNFKHAEVYYFKFKPDRQKNIEWSQDFLQDGVLVLISSIGLTAVDKRFGFVYAIGMSVFIAKRALLYYQIL